MGTKGTIIYIGGFKLPDKNAAAQRVITNGKALREIGYNVVYYGVSDDPNSNYNLGSPERYFGFDCYSQSYPQNTWQWIEYISDVNKILALVRKHADVRALICYNAPSTVIYRLLKASHGKDFEVLADATEWYDPSHKNNFLKRFVKKLDVFVRMRVLHPKLDGIITISRFLEDFYRDKSNTIQVPPLIDSKQEKWKIEKNNLTREGLVELVYAGSPFDLTESKKAKDRIDLVVESLVSLKSKGKKFKVKFIGITQNDLISFFPNLEENIDILDSSAIFYGRLPHKETISHIKESDFSIFLRDKDIVSQAGFPTKFVESISCGTPVLTNKTSNLSDYLIESQNGFWIDMSSKDKIQKSIAKALQTSTTERQKMEEFCRNSNIFDYRKYLNKFEKILE